DEDRLRVRPRRSYTHAMIVLARRMLVCAALLAGPAAFAAAPATPAREAPAAAAQIVVHLLDYIGVDYGGAVENGKVKSADEFKEMVEFAGQVESQLKSLPPVPQQSALTAQAESLARRIGEKAPAAEIGAAAGKLRWAVIGAYAIQVAPKSTPDLAAGAKLYQSLCAGCHGAEGKGDGAT